MAASTCPDETAIALLAEGSIAPAEQAAIERHVDHCPDCRELLATLARAVDVAGGPLPNQALSRGDSIGRYVVLDRLGAGGMGVVYSAFDPNLDRRVALKLLRDDVLGSVDGDEARSRLLREAKALARLSHPNVLTVYEAATWCGQVYLALEYIDGDDVSAWLKQPRAEAEVLSLFLRAGEGLAAAHKAGLVHRDFKPSNLLVGANGRPKVADFGLVRLGQEPSPAGADPARLSAPVGDITPASVLMGTPGYMAPEQVQGHVDARADQFSFCVALYEALCGHRPFEGAHDRDPMRRLVRLEAAMRPPPGVMAPRVWQALRRGLELESTRRFATMDDLLSALRPPIRRRGIWGWALVVVVAVGVAVGVTAGRAEPPEPTAAQRSYVEETVAEAESAAAAQRYLYPPPSDPQATTAYRAVLTLERIEDESRGLAFVAAQQLRQTFSTRLAERASEVWDQPGGRAYGLDLYAIALVFDPENDEARTRAALTPGELALLRSKAAELEFTEAELVSAEPLLALADPDANKREQRLHKLAKRGRRRKATAKADLDALLATATPAAPSAPAQALPPEPTSPEPAPPEPGLRPAELPAPTPDVLPGGTASPRTGAELAKKGKAALGRGELDQASTLFTRALSHDPKNHAALIGLSDIAFEHGHYTRAIRFAQKAVRRAPRRAKYRITLGDALFAEVRYKEAKAQYDKAATLGSKLAKSRLARVNSKLK